MGERGKSESVSEVIEGGGEKARSGDGDGDGDSGGEGGAGAWWVAKVLLLMHRVLLQFSMSHLLL